MVHRGKRSKEAVERRAQRKTAKDYIWTNSFNDILIAENICRSSRADVMAHLESEFGYADLSAVPCTFNGVVISDAYGRGAFQK